MELIDGSSTIEVTFRVPSRNAARELETLEDEIEKENKNFDQSYSDISKLMYLPAHEAQQKLNSSKKLRERVEEKKAALSELRFSQLIRRFKVIIDKKQLTTKQQEKIDEPASSEFWLFQDIKEMRESVTSFRRDVAAGIF